MEYGDFKAKLAYAHNIPLKQMDAFTGRLRVLRNLGVPMIKAKGSGKRIQFDEKHYAEVHLALLLDEIGISPMFIAKIVQEYRFCLWPTNEYLIIIVHANSGRAHDPYIQVTVAATDDKEDAKYFTNEAVIIIKQR